MPIALFLDTAVALFKRYRWLIAVVPLALALAWQSWQAHRWHKAADKARAAIVALQAASDANKAAAIAQVEAQRAKFAVEAKENERVETNLRRDLGALAADYADRMRADKVCRSAASTPGQGEAAHVDNGPGEGAIVLAKRDFDTLIENTVRLEAVHQWGEGLVKDGLAVPAVGF